MGLLETIQSPKDLKQLPRKQLPGLAAEIRRRIIDVVSKTGGHLASSLGVVELAIALHYVFDVPQDKIVWDVGHQSYAHKLLTGRQNRFDTLRQYKGLSGFTRMSESPCDAFTTGHSSTSISSALGMACFKRIAKRDGNVVAVIGDGSLTAGLAYEGLNQAGDIHKNLIVILNDNDMSIDHNVGALSSFLSRKFSAKMLQDLRREFGEFLKSLPGIGDDIYQFAKRTEESFKSFVTPGMLFEAFNFEYFGPINGHHIGHLIDILENIQHMDEPVLLHVRTVKGKGYPPAERNPVFFHGVGCFDATSGECYPSSSNALSYTDVFGETLVELAKSEPTIIAVTAAMPEGTGLMRFAEHFPDRFFDVGIAEQHGVTFAAGMATEGAKPVVAIYSTFLQRAYDQIVHDVCIEALPVVFALDRGGIVGEDGPTHHGLFDLSYLRTIPNMVVMAPSNENELARMLLTAIHHNGPSALRYPRGKGVGVSIEKPLSPIPIGQAQLLSPGSDALLIGIGRPVNDCLAAVQELKKEGISVSLIDARFVKPLDAELFCEWANRIPWIVTVEENVLQGGFGSAILELLCDRQIPFRRVIRLGVGDHFVEHGPQSILREQEGIDSKAIAHAVRTLFQNRKSE